MVRRISSSKGLTRIEVLVVICIVTVLMGLLLAGMYDARNNYRRPRCSIQLKELVLAVHNYAIANGEKLPDALKQTGRGPKNLSTHVQILPFIEKDDLYKLGTRNGTVDWDVGFDDPAARGKTVRTTIVKTFMCPKDPGLNSDGACIEPGQPAPSSPAWAGTSYASNAQVFGHPAAGDWKCRYSIFQVPDGLSQTVFFVEKGAACEQGGVRGMLWATWEAPSGTSWNCTIYPQGDGLAPPMILPTKQTCRQFGANSFHSGGTLAGMGDGAVKFISPGVTPRTWATVLDPADGAAPGSDW